MISLFNRRREFVLYVYQWKMGDTCRYVLEKILTLFQCTFVLFLGCTQNYTSRNPLQGFRESEENFVISKRETRFGEFSVAFGVQKRRRPFPGKHLCLLIIIIINIICIIVGPRDYVHISIKTVFLGDGYP